MPLSAALLLVSVLTAVSAPTQDVRAAFVTTAEKQAGQAGEDARVERIREIDLVTGAVQIVFEGPRAPRILRRLGDDALIVTGETAPRKIALSDGSISPLLPGVEGRLTLAAVHDGAIVVIRKAWGEAAGALLQCVPGEGTESILHPTGVTDVLEVRREGIYFLVDGSPPEVWTVMHKPGTARRIASFPAARDTARDPLLGAVLSPDGRHIALSMPGPPGEAGFRLQIVDTRTGKVTTKANGIRLDLSPVSSFSPELELIWLNDQTVRFSETDGPVFGSGTFCWVDWDVRTGKRIEEHVYGPVGLRHPKPRRDSTEDLRYPPWTRGAFTFSDRFLSLAAKPDEKLMTAGQDRSGQIGKIVVSPDGKWALTQKRGEQGVLLWSGDGNSREVLRGYVLRVEFL